MIVHFVVDEKVTNQIIQNFEKTNYNNFFLVFGNYQKEYKHIISFGNNLIGFDENTENINTLIQKLGAKAIVLHAFHLEFAKVILKINNPIKIIWYTWGFDVYGLPRIKPLTYAPLTNAFLLKNNKSLGLRRIILKNNLLRRIYFGINRHQEDRYSIIFRALKRVSYFATYLEEDFKLFSRFYPNNLIFINAPFSNIDQYLAGTKELDLRNDSKDILIGNSNTPESNHLDVFEKIKEISVLDSIKFFVPLSYGVDEIYKMQVLKSGRDLIGAAFVPLLNFVERSEYISMLRSCSCGIFYHYRQQAMGNIIAMLYLGSRIYLSSRNPAFEFFIKNEIVIFDFDRDFDLYGNTNLEMGQIENNRKHLESLFNENKVLKDLNNLVKVLSQ